MSSQHLETESAVDQYEDCWLDPLHPLGGGSSLAKLERASYNLRGSMLRYSDPLSAPSDDESELPDWTPQSYRTTRSSCPRNARNVTDRDPNQGCITSGNIAHDREDGETAQDAWTDSQYNVAATLLQFIHDDKAGPHQPLSLADLPNGGCPADCVCHADSTNSGGGSPLDRSCFADGYAAKSPVRYLPTGPSFGAEDYAQSSHVVGEDVPSILPNGPE